MDETENLRVEIENLRNELNALKQVVAEHGHVPGDGSEPLSKAIRLETSEPVFSGIMGIEGTPYNSTNNNWEGALIVGSNEKSSIESGNSQVNFIHYLDRQSNIWSTFMFGLRAPLYSGNTGNVVSGGTTMSASEFSWATNELSAASLVVVSGGNTFDCYDIASNTDGVITIQGGSWRFTKSGASYLVYAPIYVGSAEYPWKRLYTREGTAGGVRFGMGMTNAGQQGNGLLYMSGSSGDLYWRNLSGGATKLN